MFLEFLWFLRWYLISDGRYWWKIIYIWFGKAKNKIPNSGTSKMINSLDSLGGIVGSGAIEIVTGGRDGWVHLWDPR